MFRFVFFLFFILTPAFATERSYDAFSEIPVLHEGRIKPLDTFARAHLLTLSGKTFVQKLSASAWLAELLFEPTKAYMRPVFNIVNPEIIYALNLSKRAGHKYHFLELIKAIKVYLPTLKKIQKMPPNLRSLAQQQSLDIYMQTLWYFELSRSLSPLLPSYKGTVQSLPMNNQQTKILRIIPPQWHGERKVWLSPWEMFETGQGSVETGLYLQAWQTMAMAYESGKKEAWEKAAFTARDISYKYANAPVKKLKTEVFYNKIDFFYISLVLYLITLLLCMVSTLFYKKPFQKLAYATLFFGLTGHIFGIGLRVYIMERPPVATLYESIIFVGAMVVFFSFIIERRRKDAVGIFIGALVGTILHFIAQRYAMQGDTMGMLVAVLNTNFWLATHVVTISIGYGACLVAGTLAHIYLIQRWRQVSKTALNVLLKNILAIALIALFFSILGTILGGIWADQSWGRFWGWDPKENGAMLICLWLIWLVHGRIAGTLKTLWFAMGMVITNIVVALAWFGVNLLNVGLHSYGATGNIAQNLAVFCGIELLFLTTIYIMIKQKEHKK